MMYYCYLDTCVFSEVLKQYQFKSPNASYMECGFLSNNMLNYINHIVSSRGDDGLIVTSSFAVIEIINKFDEIFKGTSYQIHSLHNFLLQPPEWFIIDKLDINTSKNLVDLPLCNSENKIISGDDAIHLAVAMARRDPVYFCTSDKVLEGTTIENIHIVT